MDLPRDPRGAEVAGTLTLGRRRGSRRRGRRRACDVARWIGEGEDGGDERGEEIEYEGSGVGVWRGEGEGREGVLVKKQTQLQILH